MKLKQHLCAAAVLTLAALCAQPALAHGEAKARHGGVAVMASDLGFELVATADGALLYLEDHGKPMAPTGMAGRLTVLSGGVKTDAALTVAGDRLEAKGLKLPPGAKVVAALTTPSKKAVTVRFTVK